MYSMMTKVQNWFFLAHDEGISGTQDNVNSQVIASCITVKIIMLRREKHLSQQTHKVSSW
jgi:hypothetical protein